MAKATRRIAPDTTRSLKTETIESALKGKVCKVKRSAAGCVAAMDRGRLYLDLHKIYLLIVNRDLEAPLTADQVPKEVLKRTRKVAAKDQIRQLERELAQLKRVTGAQDEAKRPRIEHGAEPMEEDPRRDGTATPNDVAQTRGDETEPSGADAVSATAAVDAVAAPTTNAEPTEDMDVDAQPKRRGPRTKNSRKEKEKEITSGLQQVLLE